MANFKNHRIRVWNATLKEHFYSSNYQDIGDFFKLIVGFVGKGHVMTTQRCSDLRDSEGGFLYEGDVVSFLSNSYMNYLLGHQLNERVQVLTFDHERLSWWVCDPTNPSTGFKPNRDTDEGNFKKVGDIKMNPELFNKLK